MGTALLITRLLLAGIFAVAGAAKLADREGSRQAARSFGVPAALASPLAILLPLAELAVAIALLPSSTAFWASVGALALLLLFVGGIGFNLARGRKPDCHCFGQLHSAPAGWKTLVRNGVLAAIAGFVLWQGYDSAGPSAIGWVGTHSTTQLAALVGGLVVLGLLMGQWWLLINLMRQNGRLLVRLETLESLANSREEVSDQNGAVPAQPQEGLPIGDEAPSFGLSGLYGETLTLDSLRASGKPVMLLFTDPGCGPCNALLPEIGRWQQEHADELSIALVSRGTPEENKSKSQEHGLTQVLLQREWEVSEAYKVRGTPSALVVSTDGTIGSAVVSGSEAIQSLVKQAVAAPARVPQLPGALEPTPASNDNAGPCPKCGKVHANGNGAGQAMPAGPKVGEPAPEIKLEDLKGNTVELEDFKGRKTIVLFWNPGCGFCQQMLPDVKALEADPPEGAPKMLLVSAGTEEANKEMGLNSPVVLDQQFSVGRSIGASGTPSAVLIDEEGKIASEIAVGAPAVLELAGAKKAEA